MPVSPMRLCPHDRYLLYVRPDGSTWCFCDLQTRPEDQHLNDRLESQRALWDGLGRLKESRG